MILFIFCIWLTFAIRKILFWAQLWQQKEYRTDRLFAYLRNRQHLRSWIGYDMLLNQRLRRPFFTPKATILTSVSTASITILGLFSIRVNTWWMWLLALFVAIPIIVSLVVAITEIPSSLIKQFIIWRAARFLKRRASPLFVIGITGSYGKTSTKQLLEQVLKSQFNVFVTRESHNTLFSIAQDLLHFLSSAHTHAIIEYAAYTRGEILKLTKFIMPNMAMLTGIAKQHVELFGSYENLKKAKFELIESLPENGIAFINCADLETKDLQSWTVQKHISWRCFDGKKWKMIKPAVTQGYFSFSLRTPKKTVLVKTKLLGDIYKENINAVLAIAEELEIPAGNVVDALQNFKPTDHHFLQLMPGPNQSTLLDDGGTSNPKGFEAAIHAASQLQFEKKILVTPGIIDLGNLSNEVHASLGKHAGELFDAAFYTGLIGFSSFRKGWGQSSQGKPVLQISDTTQLDIFQEYFRDNCLILIEGRLPARVLKFLKAQ